MGRPRRWPRCLDFLQDLRESACHVVVARRVLRFGSVRQFLECQSPSCLSIFSARFALGLCLPAQSILPQLLALGESDRAASHVRWEGDLHLLTLAELSSEDRCWTLQQGVMNSGVDIRAARKSLAGARQTTRCKRTVAASCTHWWLVPWWGRFQVWQGSATVMQGAARYRPLLGFPSQQVQCPLEIPG